MLTLPNENDVIAGKYRVERIVGRGGMGVVVSAWHLELDQRIALKFLMPDLAQRGDSAERFRREARAAARIKSEHVVRVLDVGNWEGNAPYMVMEYLEGRDLAAELREQGTLPVLDCINYILQAIEAVAEAHALGIVHRDLKPENLFLARRVDGGRAVKVLDFGISKTMVIGSSAQQSLTQTATIMGSPFYMSPEQMRAPRNVDARSDIWALGAIMYNLLGGQPPYVAETIPQLCTLMLETEPNPLRQLRPDVPEELEAVIAKCLAKDLTKRWSSVVELGQALVPFASRMSRIHVERAGRVLSTGGTPVPNDSTLHSSGPSSMPPFGPPAPTNTGPARSQVLGGATPTQASGAGIPIPPPPDSSSTQDSWGSTQQLRAQRLEASASRPQNTWRNFAIAGAAITVVVAASVIFLTRSGSGSDSASASPAVLKPEPMLAPDPPAVVPEAPHLEASPPGAPAVEAVPPSAPSPRAEASAALSAENATKKLPFRPAPPAPLRGKPSPSGGGLTDFGGRR